MSDRVFTIMVGVVWVVLIVVKTYDIGWNRGFNTASEIYRKEPTS
jgi:hypothetical protein